MAIIKHYIQKQRLIHRFTTRYRKHINERNNSSFV